MTRAGTRTVVQGFTTPTREREGHAEFRGISWCKCGAEAPATPSKGGSRRVHEYVLGAEKGTVSERGGQA